MSYFIRETSRIFKILIIVASSFSVCVLMTVDIFADIKTARTAFLEVINERRLF